MKDEQKKLPGRPPKEGFTYFSIDCDFFEKDEIKALRRACGEIGVLTYLNILSRVFGTHGYYYECESLDALSEDIAEQITNDRIKRKAARVRETITYLVSRDIIDSTLAEQSIISGIEMQERYIEMAYRCRRKINLGAHKLVDVGLVMQKIRISAEETPIITEENTVNAEEMQQSRKSKGINTNTSTLSIAHARGKHPEEKPEPSLSAAERHDLINACKIPEDYIDLCLNKMKEHGYQYGNYHDAIASWWSTDKHRWCKKEPSFEKRENFDDAEFFEAALRRSYGEAYDSIRQRKENNHAGTE